MSTALSYLKRSIKKAMPSNTKTNPSPAKPPSNTDELLILAFGTSTSGKTEVLERIRRCGQPTPPIQASFPDSSNNQDFRITMDGLTCRILDAGDDVEAKKDINLSRLTALIFVANFAAYTTPNLQADLALFSAITNSPHYSTTPVAFFLNNGDEFTTKLASAPLRDFFPDHQGLGFAGEEMSYLIGKFGEGSPKEDSVVCVHVTGRDSRGDSEFVIVAVKEVLKKRSCEGRRDR